MAKVVIKRWDGGVAQSERPETINEHADNNDAIFPVSNGGFNVFADSFKLTKLTSPTVNETASGASVVAGECPVFDAVKRGTDGMIVGYGMTSVSGSALARFYRKDSSITGSWVQNSASGSGVDTANGAYCILYKDLFFGYSSNSVVDAKLYKYVTDSSQTLIDTVSDYAEGALPRPVVHSQDKKLYYASNKTVRTYDGTTASAGITTDYPIISMCEYGTYLAIACQTPTGGIIYLWGRDTSLSTFQDVIKVDNGKLQIIENLDGYLVAVTQTPYSPYSAFLEIPVVYSYAGTVNVRMYVGGTMRLIKKARLGSNEQGSTQKLLTLKMVKDGKLFFSTNSNFLWAFGMNRDGQYVLARDQQIAYTNRTLDTLYGLFALGEYVFGMQQTTTGSPNDGLLQRTDATFGSDYSYYGTPINPSMPLEDRGKLKKLKSVYVKCISLTSSGTVALKYGYDSNGAMVDILNESVTSTRTKIFEATAENGGLPFAETRDLTFQIGIVGQVDVVELGYEYEIMNSITD